MEYYLRFQKAGNNLLGLAKKGAITDELFVMGLIGFVAGYTLGVLIVYIFRRGSNKTSTINDLTNEDSKNEQKANKKNTSLAQTQKNQKNDKNDENKKNEKFVKIEQPKKQEEQKQETATNPNWKAEFHAQTQGYVPTKEKKKKEKPEKKKEEDKKENPEEVRESVKFEEEDEWIIAKKGKSNKPK